MTVKDHALPVLRHTNGLVCTFCEVKEAGKVEHEGKVVEYQLLKVILEEPVPAAK